MQEEEEDPGHDDSIERKVSALSKSFFDRILSISSSQHKRVIWFDF